MEQTLLIDLDDTIFDFVEPLLSMYNNDFCTNLQKSEIKQYDLTPYLEIPVLNFFKKYATKSFFDNIQPYEGAVEFINKYRERETENIYFVTAGAHKTAPWRDKRLEKMFSWYSSSNLIICKHKRLIVGDVLIDDCVDNLKTSSCSGFAFSQPWNENCGFPRIESWVDLLKSYEDY